MSYILDALRKSAAERERGMTPGLNTPTPGPDSEALAAARHTKIAFYGAISLAVLFLAAIVWLLLTRPAPVPYAESHVTPVAVLAQPISTPAQMPAPAGPLPAPVPEPVAVVPASIPDAMPPAPPQATVAIKPRPRRVKETKEAQPLATPAAVSPTVSEPRIYAVNELPDEVRATLPKLAISGAVYAETPANRMLIVSGQVFRENDEPTPGLQVEHIRPKEAILKYQGYRYRQSYP